MLHSQSLTAGCKLISFALKKYKHSYEVHTSVTKWDVFMKKINVTNRKKSGHSKAQKIIIMGLFVNLRMITL